MQIPFYKCCPHLDSFFVKIDSRYFFIFPKYTQANKKIQQIMLNIIWLPDQPLYTFRTSIVVDQNPRYEMVKLKVQVKKFQVDKYIVHIIVSS